MLKNQKRTIWITLAVLGTALLILPCMLLLRSRNEAVSVSDTASPQAKTVASQGAFRVLVAGSDRATGLCDVLMLISFDRDTGEVWSLQIPRDTYAAYTGQSYRKLNGAPQSLGGMEQTRQFLSQALGIPIDRYVRLSPDVLRKVVDAIGGVEISIDEPMDYDDPTQGLSIHFSVGTHTLDGEAAEEFVRYRSGYLRGDLGRIDAQKVFLGALFQKVRTSLTATGLIKLAASLLSEVETDLTLSDAMTLIPELFALTADKFYLVTAPGEEVTASASGASYYVLSSQSMIELLCAHFGSDASGFDPKKVFLNEDYASFQRIYEGYTAYEPLTVDEIVNKGLGIAKNR